MFKHRLKKRPDELQEFEGFDSHITPKTERRFNWKRKLKLLGLAHGLLYILDWSFDNILYPIALVYFGTVLGLTVMTIASAVICFILLRHYINSREDWLGVDVVEHIKENSHKWIKRFYSKEGHWWKLMHIVAYPPVQFFKLVIWMLRVNNVGAFIILSIYEDAFKTTAFLKRNRTADMSRQDWLVFFGSIILSNIWWTFRWTVIISIVKNIFF
jgi:hypothetical protein